MASDNQYEYGDAYPTCVETFSTLRIFSNELSPDDITKCLSVSPTRTFRKGESFSKGHLTRKTNGWFYTTEMQSKSRDTRRHIDLILEALGDRDDAVHELLTKGCEIDIMSYYVSIGQGGPWLMPQQMLRLGRLGIEVWWDIYFAHEAED